MTWLINRLTTFFFWFCDFFGIKNPIEYIDYYGCPNSKKAAKLQMKQKSYK